ncbi:hypothetical protein ACN47E_009382 [Coniothyrium glycines]
MSHTLFTKGPALRTAARRAAHSQFQSSYHSASGPAMSSGTAPIRTLLRQTTLRATAIAAQRTSIPATQQFTAQSYHSTQQPRPRTPSPPPPYTTRSTSLLASTTQWTRFPTSTTNTLSSVRTFAPQPKSSTTIRWASSTSQHPTPLSPETQSAIDAAIETITDLYGTAKDEFEIASEESEKNSTYAADDRAAAREELDKLVEYFESIIAGETGEGRDVGEEVRRRVGGRIRELVKAVEAMEEKAIHGD